MDTMMPDQPEPIAVRFPLAGEWCAVNTPGFRVPSHGSDQLGQTYAFDFLQIDWSTDKGFKFFDKSLLTGLLLGIRLAESYCWSQPVYSPVQGEVLEARDGCAERDPAHILRDLFIVLKNALFFRAENNADLHPVLGNHIILRNAQTCVLMAHLRSGSILVAPGDAVDEGQLLAQVGHSGNSTAPHLHFQLMDRPELLEARGLPCCFKQYETYLDGQWYHITNGIPGRRERIRV